MIYAKKRSHNLALYQSNYSYISLKYIVVIKLFFQPHNIGLALSIHFINVEVVSFPVKNNTDKWIYIPRNFGFGQVLELICPNIKQLHSKKAGLTKQASYNPYKKA